MNKEEKRVIDSLHEILRDLLVKNVNIYGAAIAAPSGHIITSEFQLEKQELPLEIENYNAKQEKERSPKLETEEDKKEEKKSSEENPDEQSEESEEWSVDEAGIFILAYCYSLLSEVIEKIGLTLKKGKFKSIFIKSTYTNLIVIPVTDFTNFLMIIPSGKGFDFRFFTETKMFNADLDDFEESKIEEEGIPDNDFDDDSTENADRKAKEDKFFKDLKEELPGLLGTGHVGIKSQIGSFMFFGSLDEKNQEYLKNIKEDRRPENDIGGLLSYLFYIGNDVIEKERRLELDLIQLEYEEGYVLLKSIGDIAIIFDTTEPFQHFYLEQNLPTPDEFPQILEQIENASKNLSKVYDNVDTWLEKGVKLLKKGQPHQASEYFLKAIDMQSNIPYDSDFWFTLGRKLGEKAKYKEAIACFEQVHKEDPTHQKSWIKQAKANYFMDQKKKAIRCLKKGLRVDRTDEESCYRIGGISNDIKQNRRAIYYFKKALKLKPLSKESWYFLGHAYFDMKKYRKAIRSYKKVLEIEKENSSAWIGIGWAFHKLKKYHKSIESFDISISMDPDSAVAWNDRGCSFYSLKNYEEAMKNYEKARELDPSLKYPWGNIGEVNEKYGNFQIAVDYFGRARILAPKDRKYKRDLRRSNRKLKRAQKRFLRKLNIISNSNPKIPITDIDDTLKTFIQPLLRKDTDLKDLLSYMIKNNKLKAKISKNCIEFA